MKNRQFDIKSTKDRKEWVTQIMEIMDILLPPYLQKKKEELEFLKKEFSLMPFEKINDDIFDTDSEVLKSEKNHMSIRISGCELDLKTLEAFRLFSVYIRGVLEKEGLIDRITSSDDLKQYYDILESKETDSPEKIRAQFKKLIKFYHPDSYQNSPEKLVRAENKTKQLIDAHDELAKRGIL